MNEVEYLEYLRESQHIAHDSYNDLTRTYEYYIFDLQYEDYYTQLQRDEKIEEILK
jgi:hypothetical protein